MIAETMLNYVRATPFRPFRVVLNSGTRYEVRHPEMVRVGRDNFIFFHASPPEGPYDQWETVSLPLIERIEFIDAAKPTGTDKAAEKNPS